MCSRPPQSVLTPRTPAMHRARAAPDDVAVLPEAADFAHGTHRHVPLRRHTPAQAYVRHLFHLHRHDHLHDVIQALAEERSTTARQRRWGSHEYWTFPALRLTHLAFHHHHGPLLAGTVDLCSLPAPAVGGLVGIRPVPRRRDAAPPRDEWSFVEIRDLGVRASTGSRVADVCLSGVSERGALGASLVSPLSQVDLGITYQACYFPRVVPATFTPTLRSLQQMFRDGQVPFWRQLQPPLVDAQPPTTPGAPTHVDARRASEALDPSQPQAVAACLTHELVLLHGPPGTGKTWTAVAMVQALLQQRAASGGGGGGGGDGPILCISHTNQALDHLLQALVTADVPNVVRLGSRCTHPALQGFRLDTQLNAQLAQDSRHRALRSARLAHGRALHHWLQAARQSGTPWNWNDLWHLLQEVESPDHPPAMVEQVVSLVDDEEEVAMLRSFQDRVRAWQTADRLVAASRTQRRQQLLAAASVVGVTVTGMAASRAWLQPLQPAVLLLDEASQVTEASLLPCLLPSLRQLILVGDGQQLGPHVQTHVSRHGHRRGGAPHAVQLHQSAFERLSRSSRAPPGLAIRHLTVQRRMTPLLAGLLREGPYPLVRDHELTQHLVPVLPGLPRLVWMQSGAGDEDDQTPAHGGRDPAELVHDREARAAASLAAAILRHEQTAPRSVAVLTPYASQLARIRHHWAEEMAVVASTPPPSTVVLTTTDAFQGQQAPVVILSLVRSNAAGRVGFLASPRRINVMFSRAQRHLLILGDDATFARHARWQGLLHYIRRHGHVMPLAVVEGKGGAARDDGVANGAASHELVPQGHVN